MSLIGDLSDLAHGFLTNTEDFALPATLTSPGGTDYAITVLGSDISSVFDLETQQQVAGRKVTCAVSAQQLATLGADPRVMGDNDRNPWTLRWTPPTGPELRLKVVASVPDKLGVIVLELETYRRESAR